ncbi:MAG TPA: gamma-glutamyl-phosphate reductase, partial [Armatimonadetes bacterium]|nr:gamma-glutamyl-phosphate reductase [Armatimonadota bacterium]
MTVEEMAYNARKAGRILGAMPGKARGAAILAMAKMLEERRADVMAANAADVQQAEADGLSGPLLERLKVSDKVFT